MRGWETRALPEGTRVAGLRTFGIIGIIGFAGGLAGILALRLGALVLGLAYLAHGVVVAATYLRRSGTGGDVGATTAFAALLTFGLGALVPMGYPLPAAAAAVGRGGYLQSMFLASVPGLR